MKRDENVETILAHLVYTVADRTRKMKKPDALTPVVACFFSAPDVMTTLKKLDKYYKKKYGGKQ